MWSRIEVYGITDAGRKEGPNQDGLLAGEYLVLDGEVGITLPLPVCIAAADGIGGDPGGFLARTVALAEVQASPYPSTVTEAADIFVRASDAITAYGRRRPEFRAMATGLSAVWIEKSRILICASGNVAVYLSADGHASKLTVDQEDAFGTLTGYLGAANRTIRSTVAPILLETGLEKARRIVLATDGLSYYIERERWAEILGRDDSSETIARALMEAGRQGGSPDNMSVLVATLQP